MTTVARTHSTNDAHYYHPDGSPCYELPKRDGKGMKVPTLADAKKLGLRPSVTTILKILPKPELERWKEEQSCLAVLTSPANPDECGPKCDKCGHSPLTHVDAFVHRILHVEEVQHQERDTARDRGIAIHDACERWFSGQDIEPDLRAWVEPAVKGVGSYGEYVSSEKILVGDGFAGKTDLMLEGPACWWLWDWKVTKTLPDPKKGAWTEHRIQLAAYAAAFHKLIVPAQPIIENLKPIRTANCYISSVESGKFVICEHDPDWQRTYQSLFLPAMKLWQGLNGYVPPA